jgi:hypothetical protein
LNRLSLDVTVLISQDYTVFSFSLVYGDSFFPQWESVQHTHLRVSFHRFPGNAADPDRDSVLI